MTRPSRAEAQCEVIVHQVQLVHDVHISHEDEALPSDEGEDATRKLQRERGVKTMHEL